ncbi:hypothetical protein [Actinomadura darangshiensis]|nr:hypothetical protein [Actinomadura darangshiensis]
MTSGRKGAERDRGSKRRGYAHSTSATLGDDLTIPEPLEGVLPTRGF